MQINLYAFRLFSVICYYSKFAISFSGPNHKSIEYETSRGKSTTYE